MAWDGGRRRRTKLFGLITKGSRALGFGQGFAERFDAGAIKQAIRETQALVPGYSYKGFCAKLAEAAQA